MSLEDLMKVQVTTAGKEAQSYSQVAAAIFVVTARRTFGVQVHATSRRPFRLVPGVHVAQISSNQYQVTIRGFESQYADKLLVLIDGRSVYNTTFNGVYWDTAQTLIEDIDRIEVVRGPGGSLWASNAVNGVINVITKKASDTLGALVHWDPQPDSPLDASARYGGN